MSEESERESPRRRPSLFLTTTSRWHPGGKMSSVRVFSLGTRPNIVS